MCITLRVIVLATEIRKHHLIAHSHQQILRCAQDDTGAALRMTTRALNTTTTDNRMAHTRV
jgi:hypothetical protein